MFVSQPSSIENDIARMLGYSAGSVGLRSATVPVGANATVRRRGAVNAEDGHSNLGDATGKFKWESYDGGADHIPKPAGYYGLYFK
jgi:hypothetical protein